MENIKYMNLYGGMKLVESVDHSSIDGEFPVNFSLYCVFRDALESGKMPTSRKALGVDLDAALDIAYVDLCVFFEACESRDAEARKVSCRKAYDSVSFCLFKMGVLDRAKGDVLTVPQWRVFENALSIRHGKEGLAFISKGTFRRNVLESILMLSVNTGEVKFSDAVKRQEIREKAIASLKKAQVAMPASIM